MTYLISIVPPWVFRWTVIGLVLAVPSICRAGHEACETAIEIMGKVLGGR